MALLGCSDDPTSPTGVSGSLSFSYTGAGAANATTYSASGTIPTLAGSSFGTGAWAAGGIDATTDYAVVAASVPRTSSTWDLVSIGIGRKTVGTSVIESDCGVEGDECTGVIVLFGQSGTSDLSSYDCFLTTGSVTISAISSTNITGTFSGSGSCITSAGVETPFTVTNGTFNVGVTTQLN